MTITQKDLQPQFKWEVAARRGGELVGRCFDCGSCAGICPVSERQPGFDPRKIIHQIKMGLKDQVLGSEALWYCSHCDTCAFDCPQGIQFNNIVDVLREIALEQGYADAEVWSLWGTSPCKAACPAHISIPGFISAIIQGRYAEGLKLIKKELPLPAICGRVCPHPCEAQCNRGLLDQPLAIMYLKRFLADLDLAADTSYMPTIKAKKLHKIAIIGAGPAGLTAAYYLAIEGYAVTIFEKLPVAGGMMAVGIPEFRLPRDILQAEIQGILKLGVELQLGWEIGRDRSFADLQQEFNAIFISVGCHQSQKLGIPGEAGPGVWDGLTWLRQVNLGNLPAEQGKLVVIGGGDVALDCARVAQRLGYEEVTILYRRTREEMPAQPWEVTEAMEEGIEFAFLTAPVMIVQADGVLQGVRCIRMALGEPDASGRRRPVPIPGSEFIVQADVVVTAIGQVSDLDFMSTGNSIQISEGNLIVADSLTGATNVPGIFAGGDVITGPRTVVEAIAGGKAAARAIDRYLRGQELSSGCEPPWEGVDFRPPPTASQERESMPRLPPKQRRKTFKEIDLGYQGKQARREASRCLRICGIQKF